MVECVLVLIGKGIAFRVECDRNLKEALWIFMWSLTIVMTDYLKKSILKNKFQILRCNWVAMLDKIEKEKCMERNK